MALVFGANIDARLLQASLPYDSLGGLNNHDIMVRFMLTGSTGTTVANIIAKGSDRFVLRRKAGTVSDLQLVVRYTTAGPKTYELGSVSVDAWHTMRFRHKPPLAGVTIKIDGATVASDPSVSGDSFLDDNTNFFRAGPSATSGGIGVKVAGFAACSPPLTATDRGIIDDPNGDWSTLSDWSGKTEWFEWDFLQQTSGEVGDTDTGLDNKNTDAASLGDYKTWAGKTKPTWDSSTPIITTEMTMRSACRQLKVIAGGGTLDLGSVHQTWPDGNQSLRFRLHLENSGGVDLTGVAVSVSGSGSLVSAPSGTIVAADGEYVIVDLDTATVGMGSSSLIVTVATNELANHTFTLEWTPKSDASRIVTPGSGFSSPPTESGTAYGSGVAYKIGANLDVADLFPVINGQTVDTDNMLEVCCAIQQADIGGVAEVQVYFESDSVSKTLYTIGKSSRSGLQGVNFTLDNSGGTDGIKEIYVRVVPTNGLERLIGPIRIDFNTARTGGTLYVADTGSDTTGDGSTETPYETIEKALQQFAANPGIVKYRGGRVKLDSAQAFVRNHAVCSIIQPDDGAAYGDSVLYLVSPGEYQSKMRKRCFIDAKFDTDPVGRIRTQIADESVHMIRPGFVDVTNGEGGPPSGYPTDNVFNNGSPPDRQWFQLSIHTGLGTIACYNVREVVGYTGLAGASLVAGGNGENNQILARHGGDHCYDSPLFFGIGWRRPAGVTSRYRYTDALTVAASGIVDNGDGTWTLSLAGAPYIDTAGLASEASAAVEVVTGTLAGQTIATVSADNTAKTVTVTDDPTGILSSDTLIVRGEQHSDLWQFNQTSPNGNWYIQAVDARGVSNVQFRLPQQPSGVGDFDALGMHLVVFNQTSGAHFGYQQENETNSSINQCSLKNANLVYSAGVSVDVVMSNTVADRASSGITPVGCVLESGAETIGVTIGVPDYGGDLAPTEGGNLIGAYHPMLPYDIHGDVIPRDGTGAIGGLQVVVDDGGEGGGGSRGIRSRWRGWHREWPRA